jgi:hypothetical protein
VPIAVARRAFQADWEHFVVMELSQDIAERAGRLADVLALRAYDAVQLAAADALSRVDPTPVMFACFDTRLNRAASALGLPTPCGDGS